MILFAAGVNPEECTHYKQHQRLHEDEESWDERAVLIVRIRERDPGADNKAT